MAAPIIYIFDENTGEFRGTKEARQSPMGDGYLLPSADHESRTLIPVPAAQPDRTRRFNRTVQAWEQVEDYRSQDVYYATGDKVEPHKIQLGPLPDGVTLEPRPSEWHNLTDGVWIEDTAAKDAFEAEQAKKAALIGSPLRQEVIQHFKNDTPAELETYVRSKVNADGVVDLATAKTFAKRMETFAVIISLAVALSNRD